MIYNSIKDKSKVLIINQLTQLIEGKELVLGSVKLRSLRKTGVKSTYVFIIIVAIPAVVDTWP